MIIYHRPMQATETNKSRKLHNIVVEEQKCTGDIWLFSCSFLAVNETAMAMKVVCSSNAMRAGKSLSVAMDPCTSTRLRVQTVHVVVCCRHWCLVIETKSVQIWRPTTVAICSLRLSSLLSGKVFRIVVVLGISAFVLFRIYKNVRSIIFVFC